MLENEFFSGLRVEAHNVNGSGVAVWYEGGKRRAVIYANPSRQQLRILHEADVTVEVLKRLSLTLFAQPQPAADAGVYVLELTQSEHMALLDIVMGYLRNPDEPQNFVNCSTPEPCKETSTGDILHLISEARFEK